LLSNESLGAPPRADPGPTVPPLPGQPGPGPARQAFPATTYDLANMPVTFNGASSGNVCPFYVKQPADVSGEDWRMYVWDRRDVDARLTLETLANGGPPGTEGTILTNIPVAAVTNCSININTIPKPCSWLPGDATVANRVQCAVGESPCWKLIARLHKGLGANASVGVENAPTAGLNDGAANNGFVPVKGVQIPNTSTGSTFGTGPTPLCGDTAAVRNCSNCTGSQPSAMQAEVNGGVTDHAHFDDGADNRLLPSPSLWFIDATGSSRDAHLFDVGTAGAGPFRATIIASGHVTAEAGASICCATCDCGPMGNSNNLGSCNFDDTFGSTRTAAINDPPPAAGGLFQRNPGMYGYTNPLAPAPTWLTFSFATDNRGQPGGVALKGVNQVKLLNNAVIVGDIIGSSIDFSNGPCVVGNVLAYAAQSCGGAAPCNSANICFNNNASVIGDVESTQDIDARNAAEIWGNVITRGDACFNNNAHVDGVVQAFGTIDIKNGSIIVNNTTGSGSAGTPANPALQTFMEASW
jgi:hypothetical protein